jgi:hypothetical protein
MTHSKDFEKPTKISLQTHLSEGEADIRAGRIKECNAELLDKMTQDVINAEKPPKTLKY